MAAATLSTGAGKVPCWDADGHTVHARQVMVLRASHDTEQD